MLIATPLESITTASNGIHIAKHLDALSIPLISFMSSSAHTACTMFRTSFQLGWHSACRPSIELFALKRFHRLLACKIRSTNQLLNEISCRLAYSLFPSQTRLTFKMQTEEPRGARCAISPGPQQYAPFVVHVFCLI